MTSEDSKRMSLTIGSQESIESLGKPRQPMFIPRTENSIQENGTGKASGQTLFFFYMG